MYQIEVIKQDLAPKNKAFFFKTSDIKPQTLDAKSQNALQLYIIRYNIVLTRLVSDLWGGERSGIDGSPGMKDDALEADMSKQSVQMGRFKES